MKATPAVLPKARCLRVSENTERSHAAALACGRGSFLSPGRSRLAQHWRVYPPHRGEDQAIRYIDDLETCCQMLPDNPELGRPCEDVHPAPRPFDPGQPIHFHPPHTA